MKKRDWFYICSVTFATWLLDFVTKAWALQTIIGFKSIGPIGLVLHRNPGAMLGTFATLPPILRIVSLSTGGAFLIFIYFAIQYLLPKRSLTLRLGMSLLLGGILGNVTDRILYGAVLDFLFIGIPPYASPAFNVADAIQWVGYGMIIYTLLRDGEQLWPSKNDRKKIWVNLKFQLNYIAVLIAIGAGFAIISGVFSYTFLKITIDELVVGQPQVVEERFVRPFLLTYLCISFTFIIVLFLIGRLLSHRMAGPVYAFQKYIDDLLQGKDRPFRLRGSDQFPQLEAMAEKLQKHLKGRG